MRISLNKNVKILSVFAFLIIGAQTSLIQLTAETKMIAGEELKSLCSEHLVNSNFNFFESLKNQIINFSYNDLDTEALYPLLNQKFQKIQNKLTAVTVLQQNLEYVINLKICYRVAPEYNGSQSDKKPFRPLIPNSKKSNCLKFDSPIFINRLSRNNLILNIHQLITQLDKRRQSLNKNTPIYKFTLEGLTNFNIEKSSNFYEMEDYEYYLYEMYTNAQINKSAESLNNLVTNALKTHMVDYDLGDYACDLYERLLFTFTEYVNAASVRDEKGFGESLDKNRANFEFICRLERFEPLVKKFMGPLCGRSPRGMEVRESGIMVDDLRMSVHDYFFKEVLVIESFVGDGDVDESVELEFLYDYVIDMEEDEIDFWEFESTHKEIKEITYFDFSFMEFYTHFKKGLKDENVFIPSINYRKMNLDAKKGDFIHFDFKFYQLLARYFKTFINEFEGSEEFEKSDYDYVIFESIKLIYKVYTFLRFQKVIIKGDNIQITIEKILIFLLNRENFEIFETYFDEAQEEIQKFFIISYTYLLRIYFIEFLGMKDQSKFNEILEQKKKDIGQFYNEKTLSEMDQSYFTFEYLIHISKIVKITFIEKIYARIKSIKFIQELHISEPELEVEIKSNWQKSDSRVANRRAVYKQSFVTEAKPKYQKIINEEVSKDDIKYIFNFIKQKNGKEIKIPLKRILMKNLLLKTQKKRDEIYLELHSEILIDLYALLKSQGTQIEYFIQFLDWLRKTNPPQFYGNLYKNTDFAPQFTTVLLADFYFIVPKCLQILAGMENAKAAANPSYKVSSVIGKCSEENFEECKAQAYWLLGNDFNAGDMKQYESTFDLKLYDYMEQLTFMIEMLPIFKHFRIVLSESMHKYNNEVREIFRDIYSFMISLRAHMHVVDLSPWETLFDGLEECLEFTYSRHFESNSESVHMCNFSYQRYSEMYWFLKFFQIEETTNDDLFFHIFSDSKRLELQKKSEDTLSLDEKKFLYPQFIKINSFQIFLSYIVDVQKLPNGVFTSNDRVEESAKSRILKICEDSSQYMFCRVLKSVLTIRGELLGELSSDSYNLILHGLKSDSDGKFVLWNSITILHDMSLYRGLDYFKKLNEAHDNYFSVDYFYENKKRKTAVDPIFTIESADMDNYVDFIKMKFKPSPGYLQDYVFIYEVVKEIIVKYKDSHLNDLFFMTTENIEKQGIMGIGESVGVFLIFCDTDAFYMEMAKKLVKVPDFVLYSNKEKTELFIPQLNTRLGAVGNDMEERLRVFLEYFPSRLNKKIELVNPDFAKSTGINDSIQEQATVTTQKVVIRKKGKKKAEVNPVKNNIDLVEQNQSIKIEGTMQLKQYDQSSIQKILKSGKTESINESKYEPIQTNTFVVKKRQKYIETSPIKITQKEISFDGNLYANQAIIRQSFKTMPNNSVKSGLIDDMFKSRNYSERRIVSEAHFVVEKSVEIKISRGSVQSSSVSVRTVNKSPKMKNKFFI